MFFFSLYTNIFIRNLYSTLYLITLEIQQAIVFIAIQNKRKIKKLSVLRHDLKFLLKRCVLIDVCVCVCLYSSVFTVSRRHLVST